MFCIVKKLTPLVRIQVQDQTVQEHKHYRLIKAEVRLADLLSHIVCLIPELLGRVIDKVRRIVAHNALTLH